MTTLVRPTDKGLYCPAGDFYVDPWRPVAKAVITHGHSDHARVGSDCYFGATPGREVLQTRLEPGAKIITHPYRESFSLGEVKVSFHPAGHILGSAQVRIEYDGEILVISGDYKRDPDPTCEKFEVVKCDTFITEATFGLPIYQWPDTTEVARDILKWWDKNAKRNKASVLFCYSLGKAQRLLAELAQLTDREVFIHGAVETLTKIYREAGIKMLPTTLVSQTNSEQKYAGELILAPPSADGSTWLRRFGDYETAFASGWMRVRGARRRRSYDRGFVVSDHADWPGLVNTIRETEAKTLYVTHGNSHTLVKYLQEKPPRPGFNAEALTTLFTDEEAD